MSWKQRTLDWLKKSLDDERCGGSILTVEEILTRNKENGIIEYRAYDDKDVEIKTVADLIAKIDLDNVDFERVMVKEERYVNSLAGTRIILKNVFVNLKENESLDSKLLRENMFSNYFNFNFTMGYLIDNDKDLPVKLCYVGLEANDEENQRQYDLETKRLDELNKKYWDEKTGKRKEDLYEHGG